MEDCIVSRNPTKLRCIRSALIILLCLLPSVVSAQSSRLNGPLLGFVRDSNDRSIRPILGIPGAATIGSPLELPLRFLQVEFSVKNDYAIAVTEWNAELVLVKNLSENATFESIFAGDSRIERIALSASAGFAALISGGV